MTINYSNCVSLPLLTNPTAHLKQSRLNLSIFAPSGIKPIMLMLTMMAATITFAQNVGIGTTAPDPSALLDVNSSTLGVLVPRLTSAQMNAIVSPAPGLLIYNTDSTSFAYFTSSTWVYLHGDSSARNAWSTIGNSGTNASSHFIGTTDDVPLMLRVNNQEAGRIGKSTGDGSVFLGYEAGMNDDLSDNQNTFLGYQSGKQTTTGMGNVANGYKSMQTNITGNLNTATGHEALLSNTSGNENTANGATALRSNTTGNFNVANGSKALYSNTEGVNNTANGYRSLYSNITGSHNTANGLEALFHNTTGNYNTATGQQSLRTNTEGNNNTANGVEALRFNTIGSNNMANGFYALRNNTEGNNNTASGVEALRFNSVGSGNVANGYAALRANTTGNLNLASGDSSMVNNTTGSKNIAEGHLALSSNTTGSFNTALGYRANVNQAGLVNATAIGAYARVDTDNSLVLGSISGLNGATSSTRVGIGTSSPAFPLTVRTSNTTEGAKVASLASAIGDSLFQLNVTRGATTNIAGSWTTAIGQAYNGGSITEGIKFIRGISATDGAMALTTNNIERMRITSTGDIGIGTPFPHALLQLANTLTNRKIVLFESANNDHQFLGFGINPGMMRYQVANANDNHVFFSGLNSTSSTELMRITGQGKVGIGTSNPLSALDVGGGVTIGSLYAGATTAPANGMIIEGQVGIGTQPASKLDIEGGVAIGSNYAGNQYAPAEGLIVEGKVGIGWHNPLSFLDVNGGTVIGYNYAGVVPAPENGLLVQGKVGIGWHNPLAPLHVSGIGYTSTSQERNYFNADTGPNLISNTSPSGNIQIIADGYFWANGGGFVATSDKRIKNIKGTTDTKQDLATLNAIEITDYTYIDEIQNGSTPQKKVIAQQLQSVYPQAVNTNEGIIPNVFEVAAANQVMDQHTIITTSKAHDFSDGDQIRLIMEGGGEKLLKARVIDAHTFKVDEALSGKIFVYGKHVKDLLNVDYDAVAMLNVSATQELYKMFLALQSRNEKLEQDFESLKAEVAAKEKAGGW